MKVGLQTWGSDGDIHPFLALGGALVASGHEVILAITSAERKDYGPIAQRLGVRLAVAGHIGGDEADLARLGHRIGRGRRPLDHLRIILDEMFAPGVGAMMEAARWLCQECDAVAGHLLVHPLACAAEKAGLPYATVALNHGLVSTAHAAPAGLPSVGRWGNRLAWGAAWRWIDRLALPSINRLRQAEGLPPAATARAVWESPRCNLVAVSPALCPVPPDWKPHHHACGFLGLPAAGRPWDVPTDLAEFLAAGPPPVGMTFGSMLGVQADPEPVEAATRLLVEAARRARVRAIVQSRWDIVRGVAVGDDVYRLGEAPHDRVFPRCAAVIHHGGAGTTHTAARCGCPCVVVPHIADQFMWARILRRLGTSARTLPRRSATPEKLARAIRRVLDQPSYAARARTLGERMRAEDGPRRAAEILLRAMGVAEETEVRQSQHP